MLLLTVTTYAVIAAIRMPFSVRQVSIRHNAMLSEVLITVIRLPVADQLTQLTMAQAAFRSEVDNCVFFYPMMEKRMNTNHGGER